MTLLMIFVAKALEDKNDLLVDEAKQIKKSF